MPEPVDGAFRVPVSEPEPVLPKVFAGLAPHLGWALLTERQRTERRVTSSIAELQEFYDAMFERTLEIIEYLRGVDPEDMDNEQSSLLRLSVAFAEITDAVDFYAPDSTAPDAVDKFTPVHDGLSWSASFAPRA
jgi:hypothetical protein